MTVAPLSSALLAVTAVWLGGSAIGGWRRMACARQLRDRLGVRRPPTSLAVGADAVRTWDRVLRRARAASRRRQGDTELVEWIDGATRAVRAGGSLRQALVAGVDPSSASPELRRVRLDLLDAVPLDDALERFAARHPSPSASLAARSITLAGDTGGRPAQLLQGVGFTVRERLECHREARALATQARSSAVVIVAAPFVFAVLGAGADSRVAAFLFGTVGGVACVGGGLILEAIGCAWMARLVGRLR